MDMPSGSCDTLDHVVRPGIMSTLVNSQQFKLRIKEYIFKSTIQFRFSLFWCSRKKNNSCVNMLPLDGAKS